MFRTLSFRYVGKMLPSSILHHIAGESTPGGEMREVIDAPDAGVAYSVAWGSPSVAKLASEAALRGFHDWSDVPGPVRADFIVAIAGQLLASAEPLARQIVIESGKPIDLALGEVRAAGKILRQYSAIAGYPADGVVTRSASSAAWGIATREPLGVALLVTPWNLPLQILVHKVGAALAAGCSVVLKPSPLAAGTASLFGDLARRAGVPEGVLNIVNGGREVVHDLIRRSEVAVVSFTGSTSSGRDVLRAAASRPIRSIMELGGKSANIVFEDADLTLAASHCVDAIVRNQGATCTAGSRILVSNRVVGEFKMRLQEALKEIAPSDPWEHGSTLGAVRTPSLAASISSKVEDALSQGASIVAAGGLPKVAGRRGAYLSPIVLERVGSTDPLQEEETFGPVAVLSTFSTDTEAITSANATPYGLAAGIWSADQARVDRVARRLNVGTVYVNHYNRIDSLPLPAGGRGWSGFGAEGGVPGVQEYTALKSLHYPRA